MLTATLTKEMPAQSSAAVLKLLQKLDEEHLNLLGARHHMPSLSVVSSIS